MQPTPTIYFPQPLFIPAQQKQLRMEESTAQKAMQSNQSAPAANYNEQEFKAMISKDYYVLAACLDMLSLRSPQQLMSRSYATITQENYRLEAIRSRLLNRLKARVRTERCSLTLLANMATIASYQNRVIAEAKMKGSKTFFNWAAVYRYVILTSTPPCRPVTIPPVGFEFDFLCRWLDPREYGHLYKYFYYHLMMCEDSCCGPLHPF